MVSLKQLVALVSGHETTVQGYAPITASFADTAGHGVDARTDQSHNRQNMAAALNGIFAHAAGPAQQARRLGLAVCRDFGHETISMVLRRSLAPKNRILLCLEQLPPEMRGVHRFVLAGVDAILVETDAVARSLLGLGVPPSRIVALSDPADLTLFSQPPRLRGEGDAYRIIHVGDLEPEAGVAELLPCIAAWADRNPHRKIEIWWSGDGCLRGVLDAQPLPANVSQRFSGTATRQELASMFLECDLLAVPTLADIWSDVVPEAVAAQLPVLGSNRSRTVLELITHGVNGWTFDPFEAGAMAAAVDLALKASAQEIQHMRASAAARFCQPAPGLSERLRRAMQIDDAEPPLDLSSLGFAL